MKRVIASVLSFVLCMPQFVFAGPQTIRDLFRSQYQDAGQGFFRSYVQPPRGEVAVSGDSIVVTMRGKAGRVEVDRANRVLRYEVMGNLWVASFDEDHHIVELRDPQGVAHYPPQMSQEQVDAALTANRAQIEHFLRSGVMPKATAQECAEQLIVCNPYEDEGFWEGVFYPMFAAIVTNPSAQLQCSVEKNQCIQNCEDMYSFAAGVCLGFVSPYAVLVCEGVAFSAFAYCQSRCVVNYPC